MTGLLGVPKNWMTKIEPRGFEAYNVLYDITFQAGEFVAICNCGNIFTSASGTSWARKFSSTRLRGIRWCKDKFIAVGLGGDLYVGTTPSGLAKHPSGTGSDLYGAAYGSKEDFFVAVGKDGAIVTSKVVPTSWGPASSPTGKSLFSVCYGDKDDRYVAVGEDGTTVWSDDAEDWHSGSASIDGETLLGVWFANNKYVAVGTNGCSAESPDGKSWIPGAPWGDVKDISGRRDIRGIGDGFTGVGYNGRVISGSGTSWSLVVDPFEKKK